MKKIEDIYKEIVKKQQASIPHDRDLNNLIESFETTMYKIISEMSINDEMLKQDLLQEGRLAICKAVASFNSSQDASFYTFAYLCIKNAMVDFLRKQNSKKNQLIGQALPLEIINENEIEDPSLNLETNFDNVDKIEKIMSQLNDTQKQVLLLFIDGYSYEEIAKRLGKKPKDVDNTIQQIRRKFKSK